MLVSKSMNLQEQQKLQRYGIIGFLLFILALVAFVYFYLIRWETEEIDTGYSREAKRNQFLAAQLYLERLGIDSKVTRKFSMLDKLEFVGDSSDNNIDVQTSEFQSENREASEGENQEEQNNNRVALNDYLILVNARGGIRSERFEKLWSWIEAGGTVFISTSNPYLGRLTEEDELFQRLGVYVEEGSDEESDEEETDDSESEETEGESESNSESIGTGSDIIDELLDIKDENDEQKSDENQEDDSESSSDKSTENKEDEEGKKDAEDEVVKASESFFCSKRSGFTQIEFEGNDEPLGVNFPGGQSFSYYDEEPYAVVSNDYGIVAAHFKVGEGGVYITVDNKIWTNRSIACHDHAYLLWNLVSNKGRVWFIVNEDAPSLLNVIWRYSPLAVALFTVALIFWLWQSFLRFGPVFGNAKIERRSFSEHINASATFLWRHKKEAELVAGFRQSIQLILHKKILGYEKLSEAEKIDHLLQFCDLDRTEIYRAMFKPEDKIRQEFVEIIHFLKVIKDSL